jgi:Fur family peroxide stress response transcriptional regulator
MLSDIISRYRKSGFKLTPQRLAVLKYLEGNTSHPSAEEIYQGIKKEFPTISFASIYNILEVLKTRGHILELNIEPGRKRFDPSTSSHHHLICQKCNKVVDIHEQYDIRVPEELRGSFEITSSHIAFYGFCSDCKNNENN